MSSAKIRAHLVAQPQGGEGRRRLHSDVHPQPTAALVSRHVRLRLFAGLPLPRVDQGLRTNPVGTGPFKFAEMLRGQSVKLVRNPDYWMKDRPYLDGIDWKVIENRSTRILAFVAAIST